MRSRVHVRGMSLIELLTVVAIVSILATIAVTNYRSFMLRTNRTDARTQLLRIQVAEEKFFLQNNTYTTDFTTAPPAGLGVGGATSPGGYYNITLTADPGSTNNIATSYLVTATAIGGQLSDKPCPTFTINDQGAHGPAATASTCWH